MPRVAHLSLRLVGYGRPRPATPRCGICGYRACMPRRDRGPARFPAILVTSDGTAGEVLAPPVCRDAPVSASCSHLCAGMNDAAPSATVQVDLAPLSRCVGISRYSRAGLLFSRFLWLAPPLHLFIPLYFLFCSRYTFDVAYGVVTVSSPSMWARESAETGATPLSLDCLGGRDSFRCRVIFGYCPQFPHRKTYDWSLHAPIKRPRSPGEIMMGDSTSGM